MSILKGIQAAAVDGKCDLGTLLRKCKLLAARLNMGAERHGEVTRAYLQNTRS